MEGSLLASYLPSPSTEVEGDRSEEANPEESLVEGISEWPPSPDPKWMPEPGRLVRGEQPVQNRGRTQRKILYHQLACDGSEASQSPDRSFIGYTGSEASPLLDRTPLSPDVPENTPVDYYIGSPEPNAGSASSSAGSTVSPLSLSSGPSREATGSLVEEPVEVADGDAQPEAALLPMPFESPPPAGGRFDLDRSTGDKLACPCADRLNESVSKSQSRSCSAGSTTQATGNLRITPGREHFCPRGTRLLLDALTRFGTKHRVKASASFEHREVTVEAYDRSTKAARLELATLFADHFPLANFPKCLEIDGYLTPMRLDLADREAMTFMDLLDKYSAEEGRESSEIYSLDELRQYWVLRMGILEHGALTEETRLQSEDSEAEYDSPCKVLVYDANRSETEGAESETEMTEPDPEAADVSEGSTAQQPPASRPYAPLGGHLVLAGQRAPQTPPQAHLPLAVGIVSPPRRRAAPTRTGDAQLLEPDAEVCGERTGEECERPAAFPTRAAAATPVVPVLSRGVPDRSGLGWAEQTLLTQEGSHPTDSDDSDEAPGTKGFGARRTRTAFPNSLSRREQAGLSPEVNSLRWEPGNCTCSVKGPVCTVEYDTARNLGI